jgi:hypothetical protein
MVEHLPPQSVTGLSSLRRSASLLRLLLLAWPCWVLACTGCVSIGTFLQHPGEVLPAPVCRVVATWYPEVVSTPDPVHNGQPVHGLAGRVYLFGSEITRPLVGDGTLTVDLYDDTGDAKPETPLEEWRFDRVTLHRLQRADAVGPGYTLFLPWATYRPEIKRVHLRLRYDSPNGTPLYAENPPMALRKATNAD